MNILQGKPVSNGIVIGKAFLLESESIRIPANYITDEGYAQREMKRLRMAMDEVVEELHSFAGKIGQKTSAKIAEIFVGHAGMLEDESFRKELYEGINRENYTAEFAVARTMRRWREIFNESEFLSSRVPDLNDLERRLLRNLLGHESEELAGLKEEVVLVAGNIPPSQIASVDKGQVKGLATDSNGPTSHTAIIASAYGIPAVVGLGDITSRVCGRESIIVDSTNGEVIVEPDRDTCVRYSSRHRELEESERTLAEEMRDLPSQTPDGKRRVSLMANIESPNGIGKALQYGAEGVGLFRTEILFLDSERMPTVEDHFHTYMKAVKQLDGRPVVIRTLDIRADKLIGTEPELKEKKPFLGLRSLRYCLKNPDVFRPQLRGILRTSAFGDVRVMFPLVSGVNELEEACKVMDEVKSEMDEAGEDYDPDMPVGVMIEMPGAAIGANALAGNCDFFSIGTNDLIQYTLAVDRANEAVAGLYRPEHPSVLRLIKMAVYAAQKAGIPVGLCGAMASTPLYTPLLIGMGLDSLSLAPPQSLPRIKKIIRSIKFSDAQQLVDRVLDSRGPDRARELLMEAGERLPDVT